MNHQPYDYDIMMEGATHYFVYFEFPAQNATRAIMDFSTVMIPVLNGPRAENHDTNFRENPCPPQLGSIMDFSQNAFRSGCLKLV